MYILHHCISIYILILTVAYPVAFGHTVNYSTPVSAQRAETEGGSHAGGHKPKCCHQPSLQKDPLPSWADPGSCALHTCPSCQWSCSPASPLSRSDRCAFSASPGWLAHWRKRPSVEVNTDGWHVQTEKRLPSLSQCIQTLWVRGRNSAATVVRQVNLM